MGVPWGLNRNHTHTVTHTITHLNGTIVVRLTAELPSCLIWKFTRLFWCRLTPAPLKPAESTSSPPSPPPPPRPPPPPHPSSHFHFFVPDYLNLKVQTAVSSPRLSFHSVLEPLSVRPLAPFFFGTAFIKTPISAPSLAPKTSKSPGKSTGGFSWHCLCTI